MQEKGQDGTCPTVAVVDESEEGFKIINASDFDAKVHTRYTAPDATDVTSRFAAMTVKDLKAQLDAGKVKYPDDVKKPQLITLCVELEAAAQP